MSDPILLIEAQIKLQNIRLKLELDQTATDLTELLSIRVPNFTQITTPQELEALIDAVKNGTAGNTKLSRFIEIAEKILSKI